MIARISRALHDRLLALAAAEPHAEVCGLVLGEARQEKSVRPEPVEACPERLPQAGSRRGRAPRDTARGTSFDFAQDERIITLQMARNVAADPSDSFELDPAPLFAALRAERAGGPRLLGHYHSHPHGPPAPSPRDAAQALDPGRLWLIVGEGRIGAWRAAPGGSVAGAFEPVTLRVEAGSCETGHTSSQGAARRAGKDRG